MPRKNRPGRLGSPDPGAVLAQNTSGVCLPEVPPSTSALDHESAPVTRVEGLGRDWAVGSHLAVLLPPEAARGVTAPVVIPGAPEQHLGAA